MFRRISFVLVGALLSGIVPVRFAWSHPGVHPENSLHEKTKHFLSTLDSSRREAAQLPMDSENRTNWEYFPGERKGIALFDLNTEQKKAYHRLLQSGLSTKGYLKACGVIHIEDILGQIEGQPEYRHPAKYYATIFGEPSKTDPWGVRLEGHHLSLNFTTVNGKVVSSTPAFFGANPAIVPEGAYAGKEPLPQEQQLARSLIQSLDQEQRKKAIFRTRALEEIVTERKERVKLETLKGLPMSEMSDAHQEQLRRLIRVYTGNFSRDIAQDLFSSLVDAGPDNVYFGWAGGIKPGQPHYYRIQAPDMIIEYDNVQNGVNHIHSVIRSYEGDFGRDVLAEHYENSPHHDEE